MTLELGDKPLLAHCLDGMYNICSRVIVVGGYQYEKLLPILVQYPKAQLVVNENYQAGMFSSVKRGLEFVTTERFFLTPGDYPAISGDVYQQMLGEIAEIVIPTYQGQKGHPVLIQSGLIDEITTDSVYTSLREFIAMKGYKTVEVGDPGILYDLDTMEDYNFWLNREKPLMCDGHPVV